ncbi:hypothetical protein KTI63_13075 [Acinetobacter guillouiae]|jgi:hypothetical protein|uniref:hypothetical protein n=2 Tax=Moraxellaceae TaxID=468 RepID=UPI001CD1F71D|nr:hypothetical protein [Acinetobacter guillouiae]MCU4493384.1 hypothetical protein [Acinetobacter guillouiae]
MMKIYEMIFHKGMGENSHFFYVVNNQASRQHFIGMLRNEIDCELSSFKKSCMKDNKNDLTWLYEEVSRESHFYLDIMENDFLHHAVAKLGLHISLSVEERSVLEEYEGNEFL